MPIPGEQGVFWKPSSLFSARCRSPPSHKVSVETLLVRSVLGMGQQDSQQLLCLLAFFMIKKQLCLWDGCSRPT